MKDLKILTVNNPQNIALLNRPGKRVKNAHATDILFLMQRMKQICESPNVAGIAATQLGKPVRIFAIHLDKTQPCKFYINPKIVAMSEDVLEDVEGCLSVPGMHGYVERPRVISIKYEDRSGNEKFEVFNDPTGFPARAVMHEMDHLNGVLYTDHTEKIYLDKDMEAIFNQAKEREQLKITTNE